MSTRGTAPSFATIVAAALALTLIAACSGSTGRTPSRAPATSAPTPAVATRPSAAPAASDTTLAATAAPSPTHDHAAQPVATTAAAAAIATAAATAAPAAATPAAAVSATPAPVPATAAPQPAGPIAVTLLDSAIKVDRSSAAAGRVTFAIKNAGSVIHQLVVVRTDVPQDKIPPDPTQPAKVSESGSVGETKDMAPGSSLTWSLDLAPGKYVLMCNQPAHYLVGMHTAFAIN